MSGPEWPADLTDFRRAARMGRAARRLAWLASTHRSPSTVPARTTACDVIRNRVPDAGTRSSHGGRGD